MNKLNQNASLCKMWQNYCWTPKALGGEMFAIPCGFIDIPHKALRGPDELCGY
jgi:hypothetical protein